MGKLENEKTHLPCPKCKKEIQVTYHDIYAKKEAKCSSCGTTYKFKPSDANNLHYAISNVESAISNLEKAQGKLSDAMQKTLKGADILLKA